MTITRMKYRAHEEIIASFLKCMKDGARPTKIMYYAMTTHYQMKTYIAELSENELISFNDITQMYHITEKGRHFLEIYNELSKELI